MADGWLPVLFILMLQGFMGTSSIPAHNISLFVNVVDYFFLPPDAIIYEVSGNPYEWVSTPNVAFSLITKDTDIFRGLDYTYGNSGLDDAPTLFWTSVADRNIVGKPLNMETFNVYKGISSSVAGIAVDWLAGNIYWADPLYNWIAMAKTGQYLEGFYAVIANTSLDSPHGIAVYPSKGLLFWTDIGAEPKIERASLSGKNRTILTISDMRQPRGMCIDYDNDIIYWVDSAKASVEKMNLDGSGRAVVYTGDQSTMSPYAVTLYQDLLFVTNQKRNNYGIAIINASDNSFAAQLNLTYKEEIPLGISVVHETRRPASHGSDCKSKDCEDFCISEANGQSSCLCRHGKQLQEDGKSCSDFDRFHPPFLLYTHGLSVCQLHANFPDISEDLTNTDCILNIRSNALYGALSFDIYAERLYVVDESAINFITSYDLSGGTNNFKISGGFGTIEDIAVDWISSHLYWTDSEFNHIKVSELSGHNQHTLFDTIDNPRGLAIDPFARYLYWSSGNTTYGLITRSGLDGSNPTIFVSGSKNVGRPNGLTIDFPENRLYWADSRMDGIFSVDLETGQDIRTIYTLPNTAMFGITTFQDYVVWTERSFRYYGVHAATKRGSKANTLTQTTGGIHDIITYDYTKQPLTSEYNITTSCSINNGGCSQLCLPNTNGHSCACALGYRLADNNLTCASDVIYDNFLLFTDSGQKAMYQISLETQEYHAIPLGSHDWPYAVDYDHVEQKVYWTDTSSNPAVIKRAYLNGTGEELIYSFEDGALPVGIAIDMISRVIYVADYNANQILVMKLDGSLPRILIETERPWDLAVDPIKGYIYWTGSQHNNAHLKRANMDGSDTSISNIYTYPQDIYEPTGITLDASGNYIYFVDSFFNTIQKIYLTSPYPSEVVVHNADLLTNSLVNDVAVHGEYVYYSDYLVRGFLRNGTATGVSNKPEMFGPHVFGIINDIVIYDSQNVRLGTNACSVDNGGCSHICLAIPNGRTCICEVGIELKPDGQTCAVPVDGGWGNWGNWSTCTEPCDTGEQRRQRACNNPSVENGGNNCPGETEETQSCNIHLCPMWSEWATWSTCNVSCNTGSQTRNRTCSYPPVHNGGLYCIGDTKEVQSCNVHLCPIDGGWGNWTNWSTCSESCNTGKQTRQRACNNPPKANGGSDCVGGTEETLGCNTHPCPINGGWTQWEAWSECSSTCSQTRIRSCSNPAPQHDGANCGGKSQESSPCNVVKCSPVDGGLTEWGNWSDCTKTCDSGEQNRQRTCTKPAPNLNGKDCDGKRLEVQSCNTNKCVNGASNPIEIKGENPPNSSVPMIVGVSAGAFIVVVIVVVVGILACKKMKWKYRRRPIMDDIPDYAPPSYNDPDYLSPDFQAAGYQSYQDRETKAASGVYDTIVPKSDEYMYDTINHIRLDTVSQTVQMVNPTYSHGPFPYKPQRRPSAQDAFYPSEEKRRPSDSSTVSAGISSSTDPTERRFGGRMESTSGERGKDKSNDDPAPDYN